jgi:CheY-like chemotaxis protein
MKRLKVMIVDDHMNAGHVLQRSLVDYGYDTIFFNNGEDALSGLGEARVDLLLTDLHMPGLSGIELIRQAKQKRPGTIAVLMTGLLSSEAEQEAKALNVEGIIRKPIDPETLYSLIHDLTRYAGNAGSEKTGS